MSNSSPKLALLKHPMLVAFFGLVLGASAQAFFIGGQLSQRVTGLELGLARIHDRLDSLYTREMADRDLAKVQLQIAMLDRRLVQLEAKISGVKP